MKYIIGLVAMLLPLLSGAQSPPVKGLSIGDTVPDITINNILNYKTTSAKLADSKGKLTILDFWATWCSACLMNFPKMEALQKEFGDSVRILAVAYEDQKKITHFFNSKAGQKYNIPSVVNDTLLGKLFPHQGIPHCVWIDNNGVVKTITGAEEVTAANIFKIISQKEIQVQVKKDLDPNKPLFLSADYPADNHLLRYSILSKGWYSGLPSGNDLRKSGNKIIGHASTNSPLLWIYTSAAIHIFRNLGERYSEKRRIINVKDISQISLHDPGLLTEEDRKKVYNYDIIVPEDDADSLYYYMLEDLNRYTNYHGSIEKRNTRCLLLVRTDSIDRIKTKGELPSNTLFDKPPFAITNYPVANMVNRLNSEESISLPVIDDTHYRGNIDIRLSASTDINTLKQELRSFGLDLIETVRPLYMFILTDKLHHF
jgi:thiol-disulfide isomerase/thioredoxin